MLRFVDNKSLRLTIQTDLSGFSFKIDDANSKVFQVHRYDFPAKATSASDYDAYLNNAIDALPELRKEFTNVTVYYSPSKYTLIPSSFFVEKEAKSLLSSAHNLSSLEDVHFVEIPAHKAYLLYSIPEVLISQIGRIQKEASFLPLSHLLLNKIDSISEINRFCVMFDNGVVHIAASLRDKLLFLNSYNSPHETSADYYIFLVMKEAMFNPESTILQVIGDISSDHENILLKYFKGIHK